MENSQARQRENRKAAERDWQQKRILDAALEAFAARGYGGASIHEVAEAAGFSVGHIYNVIGNKQQLFDEVLYREGLALENALREKVTQLADRPAVDRLDALFDEILAFFDKSPELFQLFLSEANADPGNIDICFSERVADVRRRIHEFVRSLLQEAQENHDVARLDPDDMTVACLQIVNAFLSQWARAGYRSQARSKTETIREIIWHGLRRQSGQAQ